jgi:S-adenosylmethionine:tRNA ribosyltransferase-isomerase
LHVGAGTFLPVKSEQAEAHAMHSEMGRDHAERRSHQCRARRRRAHRRRRHHFAAPAGDVAADTGRVRAFTGETALHPARLPLPAPTC